MELDFIKIKNFSAEHTDKIMRRQPQIGRKYLQKTHLLKEYYPKYTKSF